MVVVIFIVNNTKDGAFAVLGQVLAFAVHDCPQRCNLAGARFLNVSVAIHLSGVWLEIVMN